MLSKLVSLLVWPMTWIATLADDLDDVWDLHDPFLADD